MPDYRNPQLVSGEGELGSFFTAIGSAIGGITKGIGTVVTTPFRLLGGGASLAWTGVKAVGSKIAEFPNLFKSPDLAQGGGDGAFLTGDEKFTDFVIADTPTSIGASVSQQIASNTGAGSWFKDVLSFVAPAALDLYLAKEKFKMMEGINQASLESYQAVAGSSNAPAEVKEVIKQIYVPVAVPKKTVEEKPLIPSKLILPIALGAGGVILLTVILTRK